jgi:hypothetical protein
MIKPLYRMATEIVLKNLYGVNQMDIDTEKGYVKIECVREVGTGLTAYTTNWKTRRPSEATLRGPCFEEQIDLGAYLLVRLVTMYLMGL